MDASLNVHTIYESINGEAGGLPQGAWTTIIRLQGCNRACKYCDTEETQHKTSGTYTTMKIPEILREVHTQKVLITGGEPLIQAAGLKELIIDLLYAGHLVNVETNGSIEIPSDFIGLRSLAWVMDVKGPSSGYHEQLDETVIENSFKWHNCCLKFVIADHTDLAWAVANMKRFIRGDYEYDFLLSPMDADGQIIKGWKGVIPRELLDRVIFSVQLHKLVQMP